MISKFSPCGAFNANFYKKNISIAQNYLSFAREGGGGQHVWMGGDKKISGMWYTMDNAMYAVQTMDNFHAILLFLDVSLVSQQLF